MEHIASADPSSEEGQAAIGVAAQKVANYEVVFCGKKIVGGKDVE